MAEAGLGEDVELRVVATGLLIERAAQTREGWAEAAARMRARGEDALLDEPSPTSFDDSEPRPPLDEAWPVHSAGGWPEDLSHNRQEWLTRNSGGGWRSMPRGFASTPTGSSW